MKEVSHYQCEVCKNIYGDRLRAEQCEKSHKTKVTIAKMTYRSFEADRDGYPWNIFVVFEDGKVVKYGKCGVVE